MIDFKLGIIAFVFGLIGSIIYQICKDLYDKHKKEFRYFCLNCNYKSYCIEDDFDVFEDYTFWKCPKCKFWNSKIGK